MLQNSRKELRSKFEVRMVWLTRFHKANIATFARHGLLQAQAMVFMTIAGESLSIRYSCCQEAPG